MLGVEGGELGLDPGELLQRLHVHAAEAGQLPLQVLDLRVCRGEIGNLGERGA